MRTLHVSSVYVSIYGTITPGAPAGTDLEDIENFSQIPLIYILEIPILLGRKKRRKSYSLKGQDGGHLMKFMQAQPFDRQSVRSVRHSVR